MGRFPLEFDILLPEALSGDRAFWSIYENAFPASEMDPRSVVLATAAPNKGWVVRARYGGRTVAMASIQILQGVPVGFLVFLAVAPDVEGQGIGGDLFEWVFHLVEFSPLGLWGLVWEVDRVEEATNADERGKRSRRIRFFEAHGGKRFEDSYLQPAVDGHTVIPMHLFHRLRSDLPMSHWELVQGLIRGIYREKYGDLNGVSLEHLEDLIDGRLPPRVAFPEARTTILPEPEL